MRKQVIFIYLFLVLGIAFFINTSKAQAGFSWAYGKQCAGNQGLCPKGMIAPLCQICNFFGNCVPYLKDINDTRMRAGCLSAQYISNISTAESICGIPSNIRVGGKLNNFLCGQAQQGGIGGPPPPPPPPPPQNDGFKIVDGCRIPNNAQLDNSHKDSCWYIIDGKTYNQAGTQVGGF